MIGAQWARRRTMRMRSKLGTISNVALIIYYRYLYTINSYTYSGIDQLKVPQLKYTAPNLIEETKVTNLERSMEKLAKN